MRYLSDVFGDKAALLFLCSLLALWYADKKCLNNTCIYNAVMDV